MDSFNSRAEMYVFVQLYNTALNSFCYTNDFLTFSIPYLFTFLLLLCEIFTYYLELSVKPVIIY